MPQHYDVTQDPYGPYGDYNGTNQRAETAASAQQMIGQVADQHHPITPAVETAAAYLATRYIERAHPAWVPVVRAIGSVLLIALAAGIAYYIITDPTHQSVG